MKRRGRGWRWGARSAIVALASVVAGYFANVVSGGNHSIAAVAGFGFAVVVFLGSVWWDAVREPGTVTDLFLDQQVGTVRDGSVTAVETDDEISGHYNLRQHVDLAERADVRGIRKRRTPPSSSQWRR